MMLGTMTGPGLCAAGGGHGWTRSVCCWGHGWTRSVCGLCMWPKLYIGTAIIIETEMVYFRTFTVAEGSRSDWSVSLCVPLAM